VPALLLVRHGQASYGGADYDVLSERGAAQAQAAHAALRERGVEAARLVSGTLRRQTDTALPWTEDGPELDLDARWNEYDAADVLRAHGAVPASLERRPDDEAAQLDSRDFQALLDDGLRAWIEADSASAADEPWPMFRDRVHGALRDLAGELGRGESAVVFTSGGVIGAVCAHVLGLPETALIAFNHVSVNGAVTKLVSGRRGLSLISFNEHAHLDPGGLVTYR
jgi:broad specificity phosphatase PhoE